MPDFPIVTQYGEQSWYAFNGNVTSMEVFVFKVQDHSALGIDNGAKILGVASFGSPLSWTANRDCHRFIWSMSPSLTWTE